MKRHMAPFGFVVTLLVTASADRASASFHLMQVEQVIGGVNGDTTAQAIQLRMRTAGQNFLAPSRIVAWDAAGLNPVVIADFSATVANGGAGARVLVSSTNFASHTNPAAVSDVSTAMVNLIPASYLAAGSLTFETDTGTTVYWRLSWGGGAYTGMNTGSITNDSDGNFGPPYAGPLPSNGTSALLFLGSAGAKSTNNAADYSLTSGAAVFTNNAGDSFTVLPPSTTGACCDNVGGVCTDDVEEAACDGDGLSFGGVGSSCAALDPLCGADPIAIQLELVADGLASPLSVTHVGDGSGRLFIVDQAGQIRVVDGGVLLPTPFLDVSAKLPMLGDFFDERGLLGLAFHPDYSSNGLFYIRYSAPRSSTGTEPCDLSGFNPGCHEEILAEYEVMGDPATSNVADPNSEIILFRVDEPQFNHDAGDVAFGPDGMLYFSLGDGGGANDGLADGDPPGSAPTHGVIGNGQNTDTALGSMLRIDVDSAPQNPLLYAIPPDNPFVGVDGLDEIFAYGFRNPYRFSFDDGPGGDGALYLADVGQDVFEEVDIVVNGGNYGWVIKEGLHCFDPLDTFNPPESCDDAGMTDPVSEYSHVDGGLAIVGGHVYRGSGHPDLVGKYVYGDFSADFGPTGRLYYFDTVGWQAFERKEFFITPDGPLGLTLKGFGEDQEGELYVCASIDLAPSGTSGQVYRIASSLAAPQTPEPDPLGSHVEKNRYISMVIPEPTVASTTEETAIRVKLTSLHHPNAPLDAPDFGDWEGEFRWVNSLNETHTCPDSPNFPGTRFRCAVLGCDPEYRAWGKELGGETLHVTGASVVPSSQYDAALVAASCTGNEANCQAVSVGLPIFTARSGDVDPLTDGLVVLDVARIVDHIKGGPYPTTWPPEVGTALFKPRVHLRPNVPDAFGDNVGVLDIATAVDAVKGDAYWHFGQFGPCTDVCPGEAVCP